jgi:hypothetical protein
MKDNVDLEKGDQEQKGEGACSVRIAPGCGRATTSEQVTEGGSRTEPDWLRHAGARDVEAKALRAGA